ncbi:hypothetical protein [Mycolicibacter arupensis]|uniref:Uncharacterized protein n=1 Tax=Mycolicibacter arupensis TaxID=342002 RepID=A0A5C7Y223_9MYCO|nr:hypothetical protein [Mycolicibacter arupensis]TXI55935.1 MAG: hypothetical protein E6Q54_11960 [Mycolicibacter arupensis]
MTVSPFTDAGQHFSNIGTGLADVGGKFGVEVSRVGQDMSGTTVTALMDLLDEYRRDCETLSQHATSMVTACAVQVDNDNTFLAAPGPADVEDAQAKVQRAIQSNSLAALVASRVQLQEVKAEYDAAYHAHEEGTEGTHPKIVPPEEPPSMKRRGTGERDTGGYDGTDGVQLMPLNRPAGSPSPFAGGSGGGMPAMPPMSADSLGTRLSGDTESAAAAAGRGMATQPAMPPVQQGGGAPAGGGSPMGGMPGMPGGMPGAATPRGGKDKSKNDPAWDATMLSSDAAAGGAGALAATAANPDRGGSLHGVTTRADVSGRNAPVVGMRSPGPVPPAGGPMGGGPMGGMMGGGAGLHGNNGTTGKRPDIKAHDPIMQGDESVKNSVEGGLIGRKSSRVPKPGEKVDE